MDRAPYYADVANGPDGASPVWLTAPDGLRLRAVTWSPADARRGTVLLFQGRTEYIEKYSDAARELALRGFATAAIDWRGQGLSQRPGEGVQIGHVKDFNEFQIDVDILLELCTALDLPRPWSVLAHSMGGLIALRGLPRRRELHRAAFSAPMWGLPLPPHRRLLGWGVSTAGVLLGLGEHAAPGARSIADPAAAAFEDNLLTSDPEVFAWIKRQVAAHPDLALGGPSLGWVWAAFREMHHLARQAAPRVPCLTFLGSEEAIVSADAIHVRMGSWPDSRLEMVEGARHEVLMEGPEVRARVYDAIAAHLGTP